LTFHLFLTRIQAIMDARDLHILDRLQRDARTPNAELARELGMAPSAILERIRKLERNGVLRGFSARIDPEAVGLGLLAYVFVQADERLTEESTGRLLAELPEVQEVHHIAGEDCYLVKVRCASTSALGTLLQEKFGALPSVRRTRTTIAMRTLKESPQLPIPAPGPEAASDPR
jgi:Lrp/AsnC family leucine-responsive transcriptional regulator